MSLENGEELKCVGHAYHEAIACNQGNVFCQSLASLRYSLQQFSRFVRRILSLDAPLQEIHDRSMGSMSGDLDGQRKVRMHELLLKCQPLCVGENCHPATVLLHPAVLQSTESCSGK